MSSSAESQRNKARRLHYAGRHARQTTNIATATDIIIVPQQHHAAAENSPKPNINM